MLLCFEESDRISDEQVVESMEQHLWHLLFDVFPMLSLQIKKENIEWKRVILSLVLRGVEE
jgi:hypothetical protein